MTFESLLEMANRRYRNTGAAIVEKQHTKFIPLRNGTGGFITCKVEEKGTVDFVGRYGERPLAFEAKHNSADRIALDRVQDNQRDFLNDWTKNDAAIGFVLVSFKFADFFLIPWDYWEAATKARAGKTTKAVSFAPMCTPWQTTGKASINKAELPEEWRVQLGTAAVLDYLATAKKLWRIEH
jgi:penicillin-binding protein-related factor A (putative recombinase)